MRHCWPLLLLAACGTEAPPTGPVPPSLFPLAVGSRWTYEVIDGTKTETKVQTVTGTTSFNGTAAFVLTTNNGTKRSVSTQYMDGDRLVRAAEDSFDNGVITDRERYLPPALRLDTQLAVADATYSAEHIEEHLALGADAVLSMVTKDENFTVEAIDESVTVAAGTFVCVRIRRVTVGASAKTFWYARGVGKVKEVGGQTESLMEAQVEAALP